MQTRDNRLSHSANEELNPVQDSSGSISPPQIGSDESNMQTQSTTLLDVAVEESMKPENFMFLALPAIVALGVAIIMTVVFSIRRAQRKKILTAAIDDEIAISEGKKSADDIPDDESTAPNEWETRLEKLDDSDRGDDESDDSLANVEFVSPEENSENEIISEIKNQSESAWIDRLKFGMSKTRESFFSSIRNIFRDGKKIDSSTLDALHEVLYRADVGVKTCDKMLASIRKNMSSQDATSPERILELLRQEAVAIFRSAEKPINKPETGPHVILVVGVNGAGKTTTIGKLAARYVAEGKSVLLGAADTFRAAAIEQLQTWGERVGVDVIAHKAGSDPAAVSFDAVKAAKSRGVDVLIVDTAGRLHNKKDLMEELSKIHRVMAKEIPEAPHETWLVLDGTSGQNAAFQAKAFKEVVKITGLVVTKLDGTAKGGAVIGVVDTEQVPIRFVGVGEKASDLREFDAEAFAGAILTDGN
jgi:fused signal recognition particle receptor